jgi:hypothetical protein
MHAFLGGFDSVGQLPGGGLRFGRQPSANMKPTLRAEFCNLVKIDASAADIESCK